MNLVMFWTLEYLNNDSNNQVLLIRLLGFVFNLRQK